MKIFNTMTRQKEEFETLEPGKVRIYVCGPTVYDNAHVGHAMSVLVFDIIRRYLEFRGYQVRFVMNYTDVDDKIIQRAAKKGVEPFALAESYINAFRQHLEELNVLPATVNPRATHDMPQIIQMIRDLGEAGFAYEVKGDVYFRVQRDADYGRLSGRKLEDMQAGARIEVDERKEHPMDFALWKAAKPGEPAWDSPWGPGRPGWHIECSAMNMTHLGEQIDIHGGGNDLVFPHHENEIAQTESITGKPFARYWVHNGMLQLGGEKMSKSLGNLITIEEFLAQHEGDVMRMMVLNSSYRNPLTFTDEVIQQAEKALERLRQALRPVPASGEPSIEADQRLEQQIKQTRQGFIESMDDDFNSAGAMGNLFDLVRVLNQSRDAGASQAQIKLGRDTLRELMTVLGLRTERASSAGSEADAFIKLLIEIRKELRQQKLWALSDLVRNRLADLGVLLEDSKDGTTWKWK
ncbi:MAG: cysteine--tRNA ligase [Anaerolineales bacterium]|jgi:cysteinyl-tRNA synthetase|nr:cysteine--tRNA ligase [Anaerolineales bacterium]